MPTEFSNYIEARPSAGGTLDGTELLVASKDGETVHFTAQELIDEVAGGGGGTVTSVTGTADRITSTGGATPVIDIDAAYDAVIVAAAVAAVPDSSETVKGKIEIATQAETNTGTDDVRAVTPLKLTAFVQQELAQTNTATRLFMYNNFI